LKRVHDREFASVSALPGFDRYTHFVAQVADWGEVWSLRTASGWLLVGTPEGGECVPVWPHRPYAEACARGEWEGAEPASIPLDRWLAAWLPGMVRDGRFAAVFPTPNGQGVVVAAGKLADDLRQALSQIVGEGGEPA
jgi:hypothetical protein